MTASLPQAQIDQLAAKLLHDQRAMWADLPPWREIDPREAPRRKPAWYAAQARAWEAAGFRCLGTSYKPIHPPGMRDCRCSVDVFLDRAATTIGACFEVRPWWWRRLLVPCARISECISFYADGRALSTSNATQARGAEQAPEVEQLFLARGASVSQIVARHRERLADGAPALRSFRNLREINAAMEAKDQRTVAHLDSVGWITRGTLIHQGIGPGDADAIVASVQRLLDEERGAIESS